MSEGDRVRVLVQLPNWVGDVVMATPALRALRRGLPRAHLTLCGRRALLGIVEGSGWYDALVALEDLGGPGAGPWRRGRALRAERFSHAVLLPNSWSSAVMAWAARIPHRLGYANDGREWLLTEAPRVPRLGRLRPIPMPRYYLELVGRLGVPVERMPSALELPDRPESRARAAAWLRAHGVGEHERPVAFNVGAGFGPAKLWPSEHWAALADRMLRAGRRVIVYGGPRDLPVVEQVLARCTVPGAVGATEVPLADLAAHMRRMALLVSTDSGGRHFGVAAGTPTIVLMGPNHPNYTEADSDRYVVVLTRPECWPCHLRRCPIDHRCMREITVEQVAALAERWLAGAHPYGGERPWLTPPGQEHRWFSGGACWPGRWPARGPR